MGVSSYSFAISIRRTLLLLAGALSALVLPSCIEGEEEVWINPDASGRARLEVTAPTLLFAKFGGAPKIIADAKAATVNSDNIQIVSIESTTSGSRTTIRGKVTFEDVREVEGFLKSFRDPPDSPEKSDQEILLGDVDLALAIPDVTFSRKVDVTSLVPAESINPMTKRLLGDSKFRYLIHLPTPVKTHNADQVSADRKSIAWTIPVSQLLAGPVEMNFTAPLPKLSLYLTAALLVLLLILLALLVLWKRRKKHSHS